MDEDVLLEVGRDASGRVTVAGAGTSEPPHDRSWVIPVSGGRVTVDLDDLDAPPRASLHDPGWAQTWLTEVFGADLAEVVSSGTTATVQFLPGTLCAPLVRLAVGLWLRRWWPADGAGVPPLDEDLHEIELAMLGWRLEACLVDLAWPAEALIARRASLVGAVDAMLLHGTGRRGELVRSMLVQALHATVALTDDESAEADDVRRLRSRLVADDRAVASGLDAGDWSSFADEITRGMRVPQLIEKGGPPSMAPSGARAGRVTADWRQLPPRTVSGREWSVRWQVDGDRLDVSVDPADGLTRLLESLVARVTVGDRAVDVPLALVRETGAEPRIEGHAVLPEEPRADAEVRVDVASRVRGTTPRTDSAGIAEAREERARVVATVERRLAGLADGLDEPGMSWRAPFVAELVGQQWQVRWT